MNQSELLEITCNLIKEREKSRAQAAIGFSFTSLWLKTALWGFDLNQGREAGGKRKISDSGTLPVSRLEWNPC